MTATDVTRAVTKLQNLSPDRAQKVVSLIDDLADLEALEDAEDLKDARDALAEIEAQAQAPVPYDQFRRELKRER